MYLPSGPNNSDRLRVEKVMPKLPPQGDEPSRLRVDAAYPHLCKSKTPVDRGAQQSDHSTGPVTSAQRHPGSPQLPLRALEVRIRTLKSGGDSLALKRHMGWNQAQLATYYLGLIWVPFLGRGLLDSPRPMGKDACCPPLSCKAVMQGY